MRFAAFGRTQWLYDAIRRCEDRGHHVVLIGTAPAAPEYRVTEADFIRLARELGCPSWCDAAINRASCATMATASGAEVAISVNWPVRIGEPMLRLFPHGIINAHAGDLPRFQGNAAPNWAILTGERRVVVTLHRMTEALDAGPLLLQRACPVTEQTYIADIYRFMDEVIPQMFAETLDRLARGALTARPQPRHPRRSLRCFPRLPQDGAIDWTRPAVELARLVRASSEPFAGAFSYWGLQRVTIWRARPGRLPVPHLGVPGQVAEIRQDTGDVAVLTGNGVLMLEEIETGPAGRRAAAQIIRSARARLGLDVPAELARLETRIAHLEAAQAQETVPEAR